MCTLLFNCLRGLEGKVGIGKMVLGLATYSMSFYMFYPSLYLGVEGMVLMMMRVERGQGWLTSS